MKKIVLSIFLITAFVGFSLLYKSPNTVNAAIPNQPNQMALADPQKRKYKDGTYTGTSADAFYGNVQVQATVQNSQISDVKFIQYPSDRPRSLAISTQAIPILTQEAIQNQTANVDIVSGATDTSQAFIESLNSALSQAL